MRGTSWTGLHNILVWRIELPVCVCALPTLPLEQSPAWSAPWNGEMRMVANPYTVLSDSVTWHSIISSKYNYETLNWLVFSVYFFSLANADSGDNITFSHAPCHTNSLSYFKNNMVLCVDTFARQLKQIDFSLVSLTLITHHTLPCGLWL